MKQLGDKGLEMIGASMKHPEIRGCWAEIGKPKISKAICFTFSYVAFPFYDNISYICKSGTTNGNQSLCSYSLIANFVPTEYVLCIYFGKSASE